MYTLYSMQRSGNCYKARLALAQLNVPYEIIDVDILKGEARTPQFLSMNPSGRVPVLEVADGRYLSESNAILWYVARGTSLAPEDPIDRSTALQWMFFEQNSLEPYLGAAFFGERLLRGRPLYDRGHRALRLHAPCPRVRFRARRISRSARLAQSRRRSAGACAHGLAPGRGTGRAVGAATRP